MAGSQELPKPCCLRLRGAPGTAWKVSHYAESWLNQPGECHGSKVFFHELEVSADVGVVGSPPHDTHDPVHTPGHPCNAPVVLGVVAEGWKKCHSSGLRQLCSAVHTECGCLSLLPDNRANAAVQ